MDCTAGPGISMRAGRDMLMHMRTYSQICQKCHTLFTASCQQFRRRKKYCNPWPQSPTSNFGPKRPHFAFDKNCTFSMLWGCFFDVIWAQFGPQQRGAFRGQVLQYFFRLRYQPLFNILPTREVWATFDQVRLAVSLMKFDATRSHKS